MAQNPIHIVLIEDNPSDARLTEIALENYFHDRLRLKTFEFLEAGREYIEMEEPDLVLLDLSLPDCTEEEAFAFINHYHHLMPIIVMSGHQSDELRVTVIKSGAQDYIFKNELDARLLPMTIRYAIERHALQQTVKNYAIELKDKQTKLIEAQAIAQLGSWEFDVFNMTFNWSAEAMSILEVFPENNKLTMKQFLEMVNNQDQKVIREVFRQAIEDNSDFNIDIALVMSDLSLKNVNIRVRSTRETELNKKLIVGTLQDITSRKKIEEALKKSEEKYHNLFEQSRDAIYITSRDGYFLDFNNATTELFGYSGEEMRTLNVKEIYLNPFERVKFRKEIEDKGFVRDFDVKLRRKDGSKIDCLITSTLWRSNDGKRLGYQGVIRDITERRQAEELKKEKEVAERSGKMKERFLANMSHEIRTPINAINGLTHLLIQSELSEQQREYLNGIKSSSEHLLELVNDILDFTKIEAGKVIFEKINFSPTSIMQQVINTLRFRAHDKKIDLLMEVDPEMPEVLRGDPLRLKQILINLISNAVKFTTIGEVKMTAHVLESSNQDYVLSFTVTDTGIGIPEDKLNTIFSSFTQLGYEVTKQAEGTGLGLTITRQLVELQGGTINVKSKVGEGTTFKVILKYRKPEAETMDKQAQVKEQASFQVQDIGYKRILIVEDKKLNQLVAKEMLQKWWANIEVDVADNGRIAVEKFKQKDFDLVLMDVQMPEMDGYEATKYIRAKFAPPLSNVPILAMTAYATTGEAEKCLDAGMNDYISKPYEPKQFYQKVLSLLSNKPSVAPALSAASDRELEEKTQAEDIEYMDYTYLNQITGGNEELKEQIIGLLIEETPEELDMLNKHTQDENWPRVRGVAHKMKSSATYMSMPHTMKALKAIEENANEQKRLNEIPGLVRTVTKNFTTAVESLKNKVVSG